MEELKALEADGFYDWTRTEFSKFTKACEKHGRDAFGAIAEEVRGSSSPAPSPRSPPPIPAQRLPRMAA